MRAPETFVAIDTETTGLPESKKYGDKVYVGIKLTEVAAITNLVGEAAPDLRCFVRGATITDEINRLTGIRQIDLEEAPPAEEVLDRLGAFVRDHAEGWLLGHNLAAFDLPILLQAAGNQAGAILASCNILDTMLLWQAWSVGMSRNAEEPLERFWGRVLNLEKRPRSSLGHVYQALIGRRQPQHRAIADAYAARAIYRTMLERGIVQEVIG